MQNVLIFAFTIETKTNRPMENTYMTNPRLNVTLYQDYLRATQDLSRIDRLRMIVKRIRKTNTTKIS